MPPPIVLYRHGLQQMSCCKIQPPPVDEIGGAGLEDALGAAPIDKNGEARIVKRPGWCIFGPVGSLPAVAQNI